jgi:hypothetical protein
MASPPVPPTDWFQFFINEERKPEYGLYSKFDSIPGTYLNDIELLKTAIEENPLETILLFPCGDQKIKVLHNCRADGERGKLSGIFGMRRFSPVKQTTMSPLTKPFSINGTRRATTSATIPSIEDFKSCARGSEFLELVGTGNEPINSLGKAPQSFWIHPHLFSTLVTSKASDVEDIGEAYALAIEGMEDEDATRITEQYYRFLVFVWAVGKGYSNVSVKLTDPSEEEGADSLMFDAQVKLKAPTEDPSDPTPPGPNAPRTHYSDRSETTQHHDPRRGNLRNQSDQRRDQSRSRSPEDRSGRNRRGDDRGRRSPDDRRGRSRSRSRSRGRGRPRSRSGSSSRPPRRANRRGRDDRTPSVSPSQRGGRGDQDVL